MSTISTAVSYLIQSGYLAAGIGIAVSGIKYGKTLLDTKTAELTAKIKNQQEKDAVNTGESLITTVVSELAQTMAEPLKAAAADGKLTAEDAANIKATAISKVQSLLSDDVQNTLHTLFGDGEAWLSSKIEAAVRALKTSVISTSTGATSMQSTANNVSTAQDDSAVQGTTAAEPTVADTQASSSAQNNITVNVTAPATATLSEVAQQVVAAVQQAQVAQASNT